MDKKSEEAYFNLFSYINDNIFCLNPNIILTDYETAMRKALVTVFPMAKLLGCWFHYTQAIMRNLKTKYKYLMKFITTSPVGSGILYKIMALPLLPAKNIAFVFNQLKLNIKLFDHQNKFHEFISYFEKQWLKKVIIVK